MSSYSSEDYVNLFKDMAYEYRYTLLHMTGLSQWVQAIMYVYNLYPYVKALYESPVNGYNQIIDNLYNIYNSSKGYTNHAYDKTKKSMRVFSPYLKKMGNTGKDVLYQAGGMVSNLAQKSFSFFASSSDE